MRRISGPGTGSLVAPEPIVFLPCVFLVLNNGQMKKVTAIRDRFAGFQTSSRVDSLELTCLGIACTLFDDQSVSQFLEGEGHLQDWFGDSSVRVDRFDVRLLLDSLRQFDDEPDSEEDDDVDDDHGVAGGQPGVSQQEMEEEAMLEAERYRDLHAAQKKLDMGDQQSGQQSAGPHEEHGACLQAGPRRVLLHVLTRVQVSDIVVLS